MPIYEALLEQGTAFLNNASAGLRYNLQVFPDTVTAAALIFALLFQSPAFAALGGSSILLSLIHPQIAQFFTNFVNGAVGAGSDARCSGHFPGGFSFERIMSMKTTGFQTLNYAGWPSYYSVFVGFLASYLGVLPLMYQNELKASPKRKASMIFGYIVISVVLLTLVVYRLMTGCDTPMGAFVGVLVGAALGFLLVLLLSYVSERRLTNILGLPLMRDKAADGKPIYVCERPAPAAK
jgi:glucan phosphoethanolaminetransferase (alkaline phosphatase superfamily)